MSVIMTAWVQGDPQKLEEFASANRDEMREVLEAAKSHGLIAHRFYGANGQIMVIDEWPDEQSFQSFFEENQGRIGPMFEAAGAPGEPGINYWHKLDTGDEFGWDG
jgi:quinol monooxygenase YgiN